MRMPRLQQPLFSGEHGEAYRHALDDKLLAKLIMAYDCIWNLLYRPDDIYDADVMSNARANLSNLGSIIEHAVGEAVFDASAAQLTFPEDLLKQPL